MGIEGWLAPEFRHSTEINIVDDLQTCNPPPGSGSAAQRRNRRQPDPQVVERAEVEPVAVRFGQATQPLGSTIAGPVEHHSRDARRIFAEGRQDDHRRPHEKARPGLARPPSGPGGSGPITTRLPPIGWCPCPTSQPPTSIVDGPNPTGHDCPAGQTNPHPDPPATTPAAGRPAPSSGKASSDSVRSPATINRAMATLDSNAFQLRQGLDQRVRRHHVTLRPPRPLVAQVEIGDDRRLLPEMHSRALGREVPAVRLGRWQRTKTRIMFQFKRN